MLQKIALESGTTYLTKTAQFADALAEGHDTEEIIKYAEMAGIDISDIQTMHDAIYGDELKKQADEADGMTPLMKTAELADAYMAGADEDEILKIAKEEGIPVSDINSIAGLFYGDSSNTPAELNKTAADYENELADILESDKASDLTKIAAIAESFTTGILDAEQTEAVAANYGVDFASVCEVVNT